MPDVIVSDNLNKWEAEVYGSMGFQERISHSYIELPGIGFTGTLRITKDSIEVGIKENVSFIRHTHNYSDVGIKENRSQLLNTADFLNVGIKNNRSELVLTHTYIEVVGLVDDGISEPPPGNGNGGVPPVPMDDTDCGSSTTGTGKDDDCYGTVSEINDTGVFIAVRKKICVGNNMNLWNDSVGVN